MLENITPVMQAEQLALEDLKDAGIDPDSPEGHEFFGRVMVFGIMGVQPPRPKLNLHPGSNTNLTEESGL